MKKIILFLFVFSLILCFALPAFGSETYTYFFDSNPIFDSPVPSPGNYSCLIEAIYSGAVVDSISFTGSVFVFSGNIENDSYRLFIPPIVFLGRLWNMNINWVVFPSSTLTYILLEDDSIVDLPAGFSFKLTMEKINNPSFSDSVSFGLSSLITWIHNIIVSLINGDLSPLASIFIISIGVSAVFLAIRFIYKLIWGVP